MGVFEDAMSKATGESSFSLVPEGDYNVQCESAGFESTKSGKEYFRMIFSIKGGEYSGRRIISSFWVYSENQIYVKGCWDKIKSFTLKAGIPKEQPVTEKDMVGLSSGAKVKIQAQDGDFPDINVISYFKKPVDLLMQPPVKKEESFASDDIPF